MSAPSLIEPVVFVNHSPITGLILSLMIDVGLIRSESLRVVNVRCTGSHFDCKQQLTVEMDVLKDYRMAAHWVAKNLPDLADCSVVVPQTAEPLYSILACNGRNFSYIEEGIGTVRYLQQDDPIRSVICTLKVIYEGILSFSRRLVVSDCIERRILGNHRWLGFLSIKHAEAMFCITRDITKSKRSKCYVLSLAQATEAVKRQQLDEKKALILGTPTDFSLATLCEVQSYLSENGVEEIFFKPHPACHTKRFALQAGKQMISIIDDVDEPFLICLKRGIRHLCHFGSSATLYAEMFNEMSYSKCEEIKIFDMNINQNKANRIPQ